MTNKKHITLYIIIGVFFGINLSSGQENISTPLPYHNQLYFNRFLVNPTFSLVRENKSYINVLHRNQYLTFEDNRQNYFLGFSNNINQNTALGMGVYAQWLGVIQEFGFHANYAKAISLNEKNSLTFATNISYLNKGLDKNRVVTSVDDPAIAESKDIRNVSIQPGLTLSLGQLDIGLYAQDLVRYNQSDNILEVMLNEESLRASLQYTFELQTASGLFKNSRLLPLFQAYKNPIYGYSYNASILFDTPKIGWFQSTFDKNYGLSFGLGFNLSKKLLLGYLIEKNVLGSGTDLGWNHEFSLAYNFKSSNGLELASNLSDKDEEISEIVKNYEEQITELKKATNQNDLADENRLIIDMLILRQDSLEKARNAELKNITNILVSSIKGEIKKITQVNTNERTSSNTKLPKTIAQTDQDRFKLSQHINNSFSSKEENKMALKKSANIQSGYYLIVGVFEIKDNLKRHMQKLRKEGYKPKTFFNKENKLNYVYLANFNVKKDAEKAIISKDLKGKIPEKWVLEIDNNYSVANLKFDDE